MARTPPTARPGSDLPGPPPDPWLQALAEAQKARSEASGAHGWVEFVSWRELSAFVGRAVALQTRTSAARAHRVPPDWLVWVLVALSMGSGGVAGWVLSALMVR